MIEIRAAEPGDLDGILEVNRQAFGRPDEAELVRLLVEACPDAISLVAVEDGSIVGHVMFTEVQLEADDGARLAGLGLAPLAVLPGRQGRGIGTDLARAGLAAVRETHCPFVVVLGSPHYYPRFGFGTTTGFGVRCQWPVPEEDFMLVAFDASALKPGVARYRQEFDAVS